MLDMSDFERAVDEFAELGVTTLDFNATIGEPLLDKMLVARARYVRNYPQFQSLGFVTTLQWLHLHDVDELLDSGFTWLALSISLTGRATYERFFGVDCYDQMFTNLLKLIEANKRRKAPLALITSLKPTDEPRSEILKHRDFQRIDALCPELQLPASVETLGAYVDDWGGAVSLPSYLRRRPLVPRYFRPCRFLYTTLMVYSNGKVGACNCRDYEADSELILGQVGADSVRDLWEGERLQALRNGWRMRNRIPSICRTCRHYLY